MSSEIIIINSPSRNYENDPRSPDERSLTPYGVGLVATDVMMVNENTHLIDADFNGLSIRKILLEIGKYDNPEIIGLNIFSPTFALVMILAKAINYCYPNTRLIFGGPHATLDPPSILKHIPNGMVVVGDGLGTISCLTAGAAPDSINGLYVLRKGKTTCLSGNQVNVVHCADNFPVLNRCVEQKNSC